MGLDPMRNDYKFQLKPPLPRSVFHFRTSDTDTHNWTTTTASAADGMKRILAWKINFEELWVGKIHFRQSIILSSSLVLDVVRRTLSHCCYCPLSLYLTPVCRLYVLWYALCTYFQIIQERMVRGWSYSQELKIYPLCWHGSGDWLIGDYVDTIPGSKELPRVLWHFQKTIQR